MDLDRRTLIAKGSASAFALTLAGLTVNRAVNAQDATPVPGTDASATNSAATRYQEFVSSLAANLGDIDTGTVDTAIRTTLKDLIDAELAAGEIAANDATERKAAIDASEAPIRISVSGRNRGHGGRDRGNRGMKSGDSSRDSGDMEGSNGGDDSSTPAVDPTPTTTV